MLTGFHAADENPFFVSSENGSAMVEFLNSGILDDFFRISRKIESYGFLRIFLVFNYLESLEIILIVFL